MFLVPLIDLKFLYDLAATAAGTSNRRHQVHIWEERMTLFDMSGKVAVITGSSRGIGRAIAERMAEHGAKVVISSRKQQVCDEVAKAINDRAGKEVALSVAANISTKDDLRHLVEETNRVFGKIDTLVCNAASNPYYGPQAESPTTSFARFWTITSSPITG